MTLQSLKQTLKLRFALISTALALPGAINVLWIDQALCFKTKLLKESQRYKVRGLFLVNGYMERKRQISVPLQLDAS